VRRSPLDRFAAVVGGVGGLLDGRSGGLRSGIGLVQLFCWIGCRRERSGLFLRRFPLCGGGLVGRRESYYINLVLRGEGENLSASSRMTILCLPGGRVTFFWANAFIRFRTTSRPLLNQNNALALNTVHLKRSVLVRHP